MSDARIENGACLDCGVAVTDEDTHQRFHAILAHHARALAVLEVSHIAPHVHDRYDVRERIGRNENNWSAEAFAEVTGEQARTPQEVSDE